MEGKLQKVSEEGIERCGDILRKFFVGRRQYPPCQMVWCGGCYVEHPNDDFPNSGKDSGGDWEGELEGRYGKGRMGYHMLTIFQCDPCYFRNMK